jgi:hypothetical protein
MERSSRALEKTDYFLAERLASEALHKARARGDFQRMARIVLPLLEARRQKRLLAVEASGGSAGSVPIVDDPASAAGDGESPRPGCVLLQPPAIGADARALREAADEAEVPTFILTREPLTREGLWPVVSVGAVSVRTRVPPPWPLKRNEKRMTRDDVRPGTHAVPMPWFEAAAEQLGDAGIARIRTDEPAAWQVDDLIQMIEAFPNHEKLHQQLEEACLRAVHEGEPELPRRRPDLDPYCF